MMRAFSMLVLMVASAFAFGTLAAAESPAPGYITSPATTAAKPKSIVVVTDDNYPPFIFRDSSGKLIGILKDEWDLWAERTGIAVELRGMNWATAQQTMRDGRADVIDTMFVTDERKKIYDFTVPYATLPVPIFFHDSIGGISSVDSVKGFTVGVKDGDACIEMLRKNGVESLRGYTSYSALIASAAVGDVRVFCMDLPPAAYLLNQAGIANEFRRTIPLYTGQFHRAVLKGNGALLSVVEGGFRRISTAEHEQIERKWYGSEIVGPGTSHVVRNSAYVVLGIALIVIVLMGWNFSLRKRVAVKTTELSRTVMALEQANHETEQTLGHLNATLAAIPDLLFEIDLDGRYFAFHSTEEDLLAVPAKDIIGKTMTDLLPPDVTDIAMAALREANTNGVSRGSQYSLLIGDRIHWFELSIARKPAETGLPPHFIVLARDISERKQAESSRLSLEAQLREGQKMQAIGTLAGGVAHDFNNILATILGNTELAMQDASSNPLALESLAEIRKAASRARDLVQQILSFSRRQPTAKKIMALLPVVEESVRLLRATLPARLTLTIDCDDFLPMVQADATQLQQVVLNLATNAMQAVPSGPGRIEIRLGVVSIDAATAAKTPALQDLCAKHGNQVVRLVMQDSGHGMAADTMARLFEPFFTTKAVNEGTGLGLAVVHGIVENHEGVIVVESTPGVGSTFTIYLPALAANRSVSTAADQASGKVASAESAGQTKVMPRILYIDDDESLIYLVNRQLSKQGVVVNTFTNQQEALAAVRSSPNDFDLVVTDYNMPGMSGLDVAGEIRTIRADLPVAIISGFIDEVLRSKAAGVGVTELIFKENITEDFCAAIFRIVQKTKVKPS